MKLLLLLLTTTTINAQSFINERGNMESPLAETKRIAEYKRDAKYFQDLFKASRDSIAKLQTIAENANKRHSEAIISLTEQHDVQMKLCSEKGELMAKNAINDYKNKFFNRRDVYFVAGYVIGTVVSVWAVSKIKDSNN